MYEVLRELVLADLHFFGFCDRVEQNLLAKRLLTRLSDLGAVHVVFESTLTLEVAVHLILDDGGGDGNLDRPEELLDELLACLGALAEDLRALDLCHQAVFEFAYGVELAGNLSEVVVGCRKLTFLHCNDCDGDLSGLTLMVSTQKVGVEGCGLTRGQ